mmetsp:Transcript_43868/g.80155  ORF Transcript_43868/g.80155 Transcript_43868/m.80155 type:complete len:429 (-) Transcript_43868:194-1480(-)
MPSRAYDSVSTTMAKTGMLPVDGLKAFAVPQWRSVVGTDDSTAAIQLRPHARGDSCTRGYHSTAVAAAAALAAHATRRQSRRISSATSRAAAAAEESDDFDSMDLVNLLIQKSRQSVEFGISTLEFDAEYDEVPPRGYNLALESGVDLLIVRAGRDAALLAAAAPTGTTPRFCMLLTPRATFGFGWVLNKDVASNWSVSTPLMSSLEDLGTKSIETLVLHSEGQSIWFAPWAYDGLSLAYRQGLCTRVGISTNARTVRKGDIKRAADALSQRGLTLSCVLLRFSLLDLENMAALEECRRLGVQVFAQDALSEDDLASGRYTTGNPSGGEIRVPKFTLRQLRALEPLHVALQEVVARAQARSEIKEIDTTQVALQWVRSKGASPLCNVESETNATALAMCKEWELAPDEVELLDAAQRKLDMRKIRSRQ